MELFLRENIQSLLKKYHIHPQKRFGQNFLIDQNALLGVVTTANIHPNDIIIEIGPGFGVLTKELAKKAKQVITIEKDIKVAEVLKETLKGCNNIKLIQNDALLVDVARFVPQGTPYKLVANLPYTITAPTLRKFLEGSPQPTLMVVMVQKEVAQRICTQPPKMNLLAISVQFYAEPKIVAVVPKNSFWPQPKVDGAILMITPQSSVNKEKIDVKLFFRIVRAGFSQPRKQLINNLSKQFGIEKKQIAHILLANNIHPTQRPEHLTLQDWYKLAGVF